MKVAILLAKNALAPLGITAADCCRNSKENTWFWDNNFNNFKRRTE